MKLFSYVKGGGSVFFRTQCRNFSQCLPPTQHSVTKVILFSVLSVCVFVCLSTQLLPNLLRYDQAIFQASS